MRIPEYWLQSIMDDLGINPEVIIEYADNPTAIKTPNYVYKSHGRESWVDGLAFEDNTVEVFVGRWKDGRFQTWTPQYLRWLLCHEFRHQYFYYHKGNGGDRWKGLPLKERTPREERACNAYANRKVGHPMKDFLIYR